MKPTKSWIVTCLLLAGLGGVPRVAFAQDEASIRRTAALQDENYKKMYTAAQQRGDTAGAAKILDDWQNAQAKSAGMIGRMNEVKNQIDNSQASRPPGFWDKVGDAAIGIVGELLKNAITNWMNNPNEENLKKINDLQAERDRLLQERDNPAPTTPADAGLGRPVYDANGNIIGWDRDGDGKPDTAANADGTPGAYNGGSNTDAYADPYEYLNGGGSGTGAATTTSDGAGQPIFDSNGNLMGYDTNHDGRVDVPAGTASPDLSGGGGGGTGGGGGSFGGGFAGRAGGPTGDEDLAKADPAAGTPTGAADPADKDKDKKDRTATGAATDTNHDGKIDAKDDRVTEVVMGRVIILEKPDPLAGGIADGHGNRAPGTPDATGAPGATAPGTPGQPAAAPGQPGAPKDDWNDAEDNGDTTGNPDKEDEWGDDWGSDWGSDKPGAKPGAPGAAGHGAPGAGHAPGTPGAPGGAPRMGSAAEAAEVVDQIIHVETVIAEWRKAEKDKAAGKTDPYGFQEEGSATPKPDPLAHLRLPDGKLDLTKVEIWVVERETWKEGAEPKRYQVTIAPDAEALPDFDPINGGYVVVRGVLSDVKVDPRVIEEIHGQVKKLEVVQVVLSSETPPDESAIPAAGDGKKPAAKLEDDDWK